MTSRSKILASAAASLFVAGGAGVALAGQHEAGEEAKVACQGVNACKGQSACKTANNECAGHNACKGKGYLELTKEECEKAKAEMQEG